MRMVLVVAALALSGCAGTPVQHYEKLSHGFEQVHSTYIGGAVFRIHRSSDLPNAFNEADVFGGKVERGFTELRFAGLSPDGKRLV